MVFYETGTFQQLPHCKYRDTIVRLMDIPEIGLFVAVSTTGKVGLYAPKNMTIFHTFSLRKVEYPHVVTDVVYMNDIKLMVFVTSHPLLSFYDVGDFKNESLGLEQLPRGEFLQMRSGLSPLNLNFHPSSVPASLLTETHLVTGLSFVPSTLHYYSKRHDDDGVNKKGELEFQQILFIGGLDGTVAGIEVEGEKCPLKRKLRGVVQTLRIDQLRFKTYHSAHNEPVQQVIFLPQKQIILSSSKDPDCSLYAVDYSKVCDPSKTQLPKGANCLVHCPSVEMIAAGSDDGVIRFFSTHTFRSSMPSSPICELVGHKAPIVSLEFYPLDDPVFPKIWGLDLSREEGLLFSYSEDVEVKVWDLCSFACLESIYLRFPHPKLSATILNKTPKIGKKPLLIFNARKRTRKCEEVVEVYLILLYSNACAKVEIEVESEPLPFFTHQKKSVDTLMHHGDCSTSGKKKKGKKSVSLTEEEVNEAKASAGDTLKALLDLKRLCVDDDRRKDVIQIGELASERLKGLTVSTGNYESSTSRLYHKHNPIFNKLQLYDIPEIKMPEAKAFFK